MKILIIGASGLVGWNCLKGAKEAGHNTLGTYCRSAQQGLVPLSLESESNIQTLLQSFKPDAVVCCAAWSWVDGCQGNPTRAFKNNSEEPARLARLAHGQGARVVHFSSSYVFDGTCGPYSETDTPHPLSLYGESKLAGENAVLDATDGEAIIVRTMGVYGEEPQKKNFVYQVIQRLSEGKRMKVPSDQLGNATAASDIASGVLRLLEKGCSGLWNLAGPNPNLRRQDFALAIAAHYGLDASLFDFLTTAELHQPAPRPLHGGLVPAKAVEQLNLELHEWVPVPR